MVIRIIEAFFGSRVEYMTTWLEAKSGVSCIQRKLETRSRSVGVCHVQTLVIAKDCMRKVNQSGKIHSRVLEP